MESIGAKLKKARESKDVSLDEAAQKTKIRKNILLALEEDNNLEKSLGSFYVRNFLKSYATYLGLDSAALLEEYTQKDVKTSHHSVLQVKKESEKSGGHNYKKWLFWFFASVFIVVSFAGYLKLQKRIKKEAAGRTLKVDSKKKLPAVQAEKIVKSKVSIPKNMQLNLQAAAKEDTWIQIKSDGKVIFQNVLRAGHTEEWKADDKIQMWIGNAGGVSLVLNGYKLGSPGKNGQVIKEIIFTRQGMRVESRQ